MNKEKKRKDTSKQLRKRESAYDKNSNTLPKYFCFESK